MRSRFFIFIFFVAGISSNSLAQEVNCSFSKNKILIGEQINLLFKVKAANSKSIIWPKITDTIIKQIEVLDSTIKINDSLQEFSKNYLVTSFDSGYYAIAPFKFYIDSQLVESKPLLLEVHTVDVDTTKAIRDIKEIKSENYSLASRIKDWFLDYWLFVVFILVVAVIIWYYIKKRSKPIVVAPKIVLPLHQQLLLDLDNLESKELWQNGQVKLYYVELTELLRAYTEKRYKVKAMEQTTMQLTKSLKPSGIKKEPLQILTTILETADLVKFAKSIPTDYDNKAVIENAKRFATLTKVKEEVPNA